MPIFFRSRRESQEEKLSYVSENYRLKYGGVCWKEWSYYFLVTLDWNGTNFLIAQDWNVVNGIWRKEWHERNGKEWNSTEWNGRMNARGWECRVYSLVLCLS